MSQALLDHENGGSVLLNGLDRARRSPLHHAVKNGHFEVVRYLVLQGADVNWADSSDNSVLHYACAYGWRAIVELLMAAGANCNAMNMWKLTPLFIAMLKGHLGCAEQVLKADNVNVNARDSDVCVNPVFADTGFHGLICVSRFC